MSITKKQQKFVSAQVYFSRYHFKKYFLVIQNSIWQQNQTLKRFSNISKDNFDI